MQELTWGITNRQHTAAEADLANPASHSTALPSRDAFGSSFKNFKDGQPTLSELASTAVNQAFQPLTRTSSEGIIILQMHKNLKDLAVLVSKCSNILDCIQSKA